MWSILPSSGFLFLITRSLKVVPGGSTSLLQWFYLSYSISCLCSYFCSGILSFLLFIFYVYSSGHSLQSVRTQDSIF